MEAEEPGKVAPVIAFSQGAMKGKTAYVVADLEGSTGAWTKEHALWGTPEWQEARVELTRDLNAVAAALFARGARGVVVKDWHRTGFNVIPAYLDKRVKLVSGYYLGPAVGYGKLYDADFALFVGLHAASGNEKGFLPHTLTSRIAEIVVNGKRVCEAELFATVLSAFKVPVCFFSGCPEACREVQERMDWVSTYAIPKAPEIYSDEGKRNGYIQEKRAGLIKKIKEIPGHPSELPLFTMKPPFNCQVIFHEEAQAWKMNPWGFPQEGKTLHFASQQFPEFYENLLKIAYFPKWAYSLRRVILPFTRGMGKIQSLKHQ
jgi:D-amino peptidase